MTKFRKKISYLSIMMLVACSMTLIACGSDSDDGPGDIPDNLIGTWSGSSGRRSVNVTFNRDGTGTEEMDFNSSYSRYGVATFTYKFDNNKIKCTGTWTDADSEGQTSTRDWSTTYEYHGNSLTGEEFSDVTQFTK